VVATLKAFPFKNKKGEVTLSRAAEVAELGFFQFKEILKDRGVRIEVSRQSKEEIGRGVELLRQLRKKKNDSSHLSKRSFKNK
jgi:hypothetical protein